MVILVCILGNTILLKATFGVLNTLLVTGFFAAIFSVYFTFLFLNCFFTVVCFCFFAFGTRPYREVEHEVKKAIERTNAIILIFIVLADNFHKYKTDVFKNFFAPINFVEYSLSVSCRTDVTCHSSESRSIIFNSPRLYF